MVVPVLEPGTGELKRAGMGNEKLAEPLSSGCGWRGTRGD